MPSTTRHWSRDLVVCVTCPGDKVVHKEVTRIPPLKGDISVITRLLYPCNAYIYCHTVAALCESWYRLCFVYFCYCHDIILLFLRSETSSGLHAAPEVDP